MRELQEPTVGTKRDRTVEETILRDDLAETRHGAGALLGEADDEGDALGGAVFGALAGGAASAVDVNARREAIVVACMRGRGHRVVG